MIYYGDSYLSFRYYLVASNYKIVAMKGEGLVHEADDGMYAVSLDGLRVLSCTKVHYATKEIERNYLVCRTPRPN